MAEGFVKAFRWAEDFVVLGVPGSKANIAPLALSYFMHLS